MISEYYNIQRDELQLERRTVRAPFDGTYTEVYMEQGAYTNTGGRVARAIQTNNLEMEVPMVRSDAAWIQLGDMVQVISEARSMSWEGQVIRKGQFVDENTQSQSIFIRIRPKAKQSLLAGEYLTAVFPVRPIEAVMEIPRNSVFNTNEVFVVQNGRLAKKQIDVVKVNERTLIFKGIPEGDTVVVQQLINVSEGTLVQTDKDAPSGPGPGGPGGPENSGQQESQDRSSEQGSGERTRANS